MTVSVRVQRPADWAAKRPTYLPPPYIPPGAPMTLRDDTGHYGDTYRRHVID